MILAHIFGRVPLATTYILPFEIHKILGAGTYGTSLDATFPEVADNWGYVTHFDLTLKRRFLYRGQKRSFLNAGCPVPKGYPGALFPLAKATYELPRRPQPRQHADPGVPGGGLSLPPSLVVRTRSPASGCGVSLPLFLLVTPLHF